MPSTPILDSLDAVLKKLPSTGRGFAETSLTTSGFKTEIGHKISAGWTVSVYAENKWKAKPEAGILLKGKW